MKKYLHQIIDEDYETYLLGKNDNYKTKYNENIELTASLLSDCEDINDCKFALECVDMFGYYSIDLSQFYNFNKLIIGLFRHIVANITTFEFKKTLSIIEKTSFGTQYLLDKMDETIVNPKICTEITLNISTEIDYLFEMNISFV